MSNYAHDHKFEDLSPQERELQERSDRQYQLMASNGHLTGVCTFSTYTPVRHTPEHASWYTPSGEAFIWLSGRSATVKEIKNFSRMMARECRLREEDNKRKEKEEWDLIPSHKVLLWLKQENLRGWNWRKRQI